ncbi:MAG: ABC transporter substrate-binding protein [Mesorhizobium sp.]|uniref:ABC transporter substrate-binding protein n=3 Tax=Mesorhizobium TaxID=68287 RepID=UPI000FCAD65E|nr:MULTISPECIES: ABC transporter substrate-binding protein [unclassified Mesorhizobium]RUV76202.1 ABC transporter substrate-binding protein [Mesorhizobium sp. M5C.F.Cr.IN.023.01.1.1]RWF87814.1 MAG: ABC transporter substrate-binding protein [Mesorhizobium sp.]RWF92275.1 MAG: ABC transporter substrate-binding protein [Mesorhizobium sp.]RWI35261.1 MAG: ABC transporter substrate-binding protein [Mesorhizobium sp.]RWI44155.1 MAG: ABC transporter substrate-binding protein [Mesorhizobium sp.]
MTKESHISFKAGISRRYFLQVTGAGVVTATALGASAFRAQAEPYGKFTWISPRGTLEVLDDYPYWAAKKAGYFGDLDTDMQPGPSDGTATVKFVDVGQADMGFPSPGVFSFAIQNGMKLKSVFHMGARDTFSLAFRKGEGTNDLKTLEGKTILLGSAAWQSITDPLLASQGVDIKKVKYVEAGWPTWGTALAGGQGDAALSREGLRAEWIAKNLDFEYWLGVQNSKLPANTFVVRSADLDDPDRKAFLEKYLRGWAMGLEFGYQNPRAAVEAVFEQFPTLAKNLGPELGTTSILQQINVFRGDMDKREGWGSHDMASWQGFFDQIHKIGQTTSPVKAEDVCTNELIGPANDFDKAKVRADADGAKLSEGFAALDVEKIKAHLFDSAVK